MSFKKCTLTIEPLSFDVLCSFKPIPMQEWCMAETIEMFRGGLPPHQAVLLADGEPVLVMGLLPIDGKSYWTWSIFGIGFKLIHYRKFIKFFKEYLNLLEWETILHIIDKEKPWTRHMAASLGFSFSHDCDDRFEWWVINV